MTTLGRILIPVLALVIGMGTGCSAATSSESAKDSGQEGAELEWSTDFAAAKAEAAKRGVPILADFTGSDWCGWCIKLDREVFSKEAFESFAEENLVLFMADFPRAKKQSAEVKEQNDELAKRYGIRGFPTVLLLDKDGKVLARTGYQRGGADSYVSHLKSLIKKNPSS